MKQKSIRIAIAAALATTSATVATLATAQTSTSDSAQNEKKSVQRVETVRVTGTTPHDAPSLDAPAGTGSRLNMTVRDTPASVTVVSGEVLEKRGAHDSQEALKSIPGVMAASPPGSAGTIAYRGFGTSNITQLFNGITVQYDAISGRPIDSWIVDRVEGIGGPSTFLFGAGAVGGSVNVVSKLADPKADFKDVRFAIGSYKKFQVAAGINQRFGDPAGVRNTARLDVNVTGVEGWVNEMERRSRQVAASLRTDISARLSHTFAAEHQREEVDRIYWGTPLLKPTVGQGLINPSTRFVNYNSADGFYGQDVHWLRSITEYKPSATTRITNTIYKYGAVRDYRNVETYTFNTANTAVTRSSPLLQRHDHDLLGNRTEVTHEMSLAGMKSDWAAGLDFSVNKQTRFPRSLTLNVSTVDPVNFTTENFFSIPGMVPGFVPDRDNKVSMLAFFLENRTRVAPNFSVVTALRHDDIKLEGTNKRPTTISASNPAYFKTTYTPLTGRLAAVYDLSPTANVYVQYSTAADPPAGILTTASFSQVRTFDLTKGRQFEVGSKFNFADGRGAATLAAYSIVRKNLAMADPANPGSGVTIPIGSQSSKGLEATLSAKLTRSLTLEANAAYADAQYDDFIENVSGVATSRAGNVPNNVPAFVANAWLTYRLSPKWELGFDARHVSKRYGNTANTLYDSAYTLLGAYAQYQLSDRTTITARVRNATDALYAASVGSMFYLGAPRTFELALQARF